jgi:hypothetical protein
LALGPKAQELAAVMSFSSNEPVKG